MSENPTMDIIDSYDLFDVLDNPGTDDTAEAGGRSTERHDSEFGFRVDIADDPAPVERLKALIQRRPKTVRKIELVVGHGRYVAVTYYRRGSEALQVVMDSVTEMQDLGFTVTSVTGVAKHGTATTPYQPLDEVTAQANAWLAEHKEGGEDSGQLPPG